MVMVYNAPVMMCCGMPRGKCTCEGHKNRRHRGHKIKPLGIPTLNFDDTKSDKVATRPGGVTIVNNQGRAGIGVPTMEFSPEKKPLEKKPVLTSNTSNIKGQGGIGVPVMEF